MDVFPAEQPRQIRVQLATTLQGIIAQTLIPRMEGGLVVAQEILVVNDAVRALIRDGKSPQLRNVMQTGGGEGMQTLEDALNGLVCTDVVSREVAVDHANVPALIREYAGPAPSASPDSDEEPDDQDESDTPPGSPDRYGRTRIVTPPGRSTATRTQARRTR